LYYYRLQHVTNTNRTIKQYTNKEYKTGVQSEITFKKEDIQYERRETWKGRKCVKDEKVGKEERFLRS